MNTITAEFIDMVDTIRLQLLECKTKAAVEDVFSKANIEDFAVKTEFLHRAMQIQQIYGVQDNTIAPNEQEVYEYYLKFYLNGEWKDFV